MEVDEEGRVAIGDQHHLQLHHGTPPLRGQLHLHRQLLTRLPVPDQVHLHRNTPRNMCITRCICIAIHHATRALPGAPAPYHTPQYLLYQWHLHRTTPRNTSIARCICTVPHPTIRTLPGAPAPYHTSQHMHYQVHMHISYLKTREQVHLHRTTPRTLPGAPAPYHTKQRA